MFTHNINSTLFKVFRWILIIGFGAYSGGLAIELFLHYSSNPLLQIVYGTAGLLWDLFMFVNLVLMKTALKFRDFSKFAAYCALYIVLVVIGLIGAIGFNVANVAHQTAMVKSQDTTSDNSSDLTRLNNLYDSDNMSLKSIDNSIQVTNPAWTKTLGDLGTEKTELQATMQDLLSQINTLKSQNKSSVPTDIAAQDIFDSVASVLSFISPSGEFWRNFVFFLFSIIIQLGIATMAPVLAESTKKSSIDKGKMMKYIDALFDNKGLARLNNDTIIMEKTGLTEKECSDFRNTLYGMPEYKKSPMLIRQQGAIKSNLTVQTFKTVVLVYLDSGKVE